MEKTLGTMIAELRKNNGMTQAELAEKMNVTDKAVSKWERDLSCPDVSSFPRLAEVLGVTVDELMHGMKKENEHDKENLVSLILRCISIAMGVGVAVLSIMGKIETENALTMLGIGLACIAIYSLKGKPQN